MAADTKFSQFTDGGEMKVGDQVVGLRSSDNARFNFPGTGIKDSSGNYLFKYATTGASAVNYLVFTSSDTGQPAKISSDGIDAAVGINIDLKSTGLLFVNASTGINEITNDATMATATASNLNSALATKTYIDNTIAGSVISVAGTSGRIMVNGVYTPQTGAVVVNIDTGYVGQTSITTLGTVTTGTWNATAIDLATYVSGNLAVSHLNSGTGATSTTYWQGDGTWATISGASITGTALTKIDDTNVTLTLGGTPATALLRAASLTLGWNGQLSVARGGTGLAALTAYSVICAGTTATGAFQNVSGVGAALQVLVSNGPAALPSWQPVPGLVPAALTKVDDTNITLTLGGTPATSLLQAVSITAGWTGVLAETRGGTAQSTYTLGDTLYASAANTLSKLAGNTTAGIQYLSQTGTGAVSAAPAWATISGGDITGAALTKTDDTNVTLTLGGTPTTALLRATSLTLGWTGTLSMARGGTGANLTGGNSGFVYTSSSTTMAVLTTSSTGKLVRSQAIGSPTWSTALFADTYTASNILYSNGANNVVGLSTANGAVLITSNTGVPSLLSGNGASRNMLQSTLAGAPAWSTSVWPATTTTNRLLYSNSTNNVTELLSANSAVLITNGTGVPSWSATMTNGQIIIGSTGVAPVPATLTAGAGVSITNGAGSITIAASGGGLTIATIAGTTQTAAVQTVYYALNAGQTTVTLPTTYAVGDIVKLVGATANTGGWILTAATGDTIRVNNATTSAGGTVTSAALAGQTIQVECDVANTSWVMTSTVSTILTTA